MSQHIATMLPSEIMSRIPISSPTPNTSPSQSLILLSIIFATLQYNTLLTCERTCLQSLCFADDTYMYDDAACGAAMAGRPPHQQQQQTHHQHPLHPHHHHHQGHWYDEPPYESDPDDFLMSGMQLGPAAKIQVSSSGAHATGEYLIES